jgi:pimeloyl-ACP methyl ester carboxylesterase
VTEFLLALPFTVLAVYSVFSAFKYTRLISNIFMGLVYRPSWQPALSSRGERIGILDSSDKEVQALVVEKGQPQKLVIFCHESGADKESWEKYASFLPEAGYRVLSVDFDEKKEGPEAGSLSQWPEERDVERLLTVIRWARRAYAPREPLVFFGVSKGANIAFAASFRAAAPCVVVADGLFSMKEIFRDYIRRWAPILVKPNLFGQYYPDWVVNLFTELGFWHCQRRSGKKFIEVDGLLKKKHAPLLMIHGEKDDYVPVSHQRFLRRLDSAKEPGAHWSVPEAGHNEAVLTQRAVYEKEVVEFLEKASTR